MDERRLESCRFATNAEINFHVDGEAHRLQLHNVSVQGCMTDSLGGVLMNGRRVAVEFLDQVSLPAQVMWQRGSFAGLRLLRPLTRALIWHLTSPDNAVDDDGQTPVDRFGRPLAVLPKFPLVMRSLRLTASRQAASVLNGCNPGIRS